MLGQLLTLAVYSSGVGRSLQGWFTARGYIPDCSLEDAPSRLTSARLQYDKLLPVLPNVYCETPFPFTARFTTPPVQGRASTLILVACTAWADDCIAILATAAVAAVRRAGIHLMWDRRTPQDGWLAGPFEIQSRDAALRTDDVVGHGRDPVVR